MRIATLSFDDGFADSFSRAAAIYEKHGLRASFNIIASAHLPGWTPPNPSLAGLGDFGLWRDLAARGHEIMPHGWAHEDLRKIPFSQGRDLTLRCLDLFEKELPSFRRSEAVYNFPYNASTPEMEAWLPTVVRAFRTGWSAVNPLPTRSTVKLTCTSDGPENCEPALDAAVADLLSSESAWLIFNTHGLDSQGWGPIRASYLDRLLERLLSSGVTILPASHVLSLFAR